MSVTLAKHFVSKWKLFCFPVLALAVSGSNSWAQAPSIVFDAQQTVGYQYSGPQGIAVSSNGTVFIADTGNNRIIALDTFLPQPGVNNIVSTAPYALNAPETIALDAHGNLFVGDAPATGGRIIELYGDGNGNLTGTANPTPIASGAPLVNPIALTFDSAGTLFIGDLSANGSIYSLAAGTTALTPLTFTGLPAQFTPAALLRDASNNLYISDNGGFSQTDLGGIYKAPDTGGTATPIPTQQFSVNQPSGMAFDAAGNLYVATLLGTGSGPNPGQQFLVIPAASPGTPYILPNSGISSGASLAFDAQGNLDVLDSVDGAVIQLSSPNPVNLGDVFLGQTGSPVLFNFEFNARVNLRGFRVLSQGDVSTEISQANGGNCTLGNHTTGNDGQAISAYYPYSCKEYYEGTPTYPGVRTGAIQVRGAGNTIVASAPVWQTGFAGVEVVTPLVSTVTASGLQQPQAVAISGLNNTVYVADTLAGKVFSYPGLGAKTAKTVNTGTIALSAPSALALDGAGDLYIADFDNAEVVKVPTTTGAAPSVVNTGGLLQHPIALAIDFLGNMYIGDAGPAGVDAGTGNPGFLVKVPVGGAAFKMPIPASANFSIIFPQALATDPYTADLLIGDGGDPSSVGQVDKIFANGSGGGTGPINGVTDPTGLAFDQAEDLYILDGTANTITVVGGTNSGTTPWLLNFDNSSLSAASALGISAGGQSFVIANIGSGSSNNLVYLNGNASKLAFGDVNVGTPSTPQTAAVYNIGNLDLTLKTPYYVTNGTNAAFSVLNSSTCSNGLMLAPSIPCTMNIQFTPQSLGFTSQQIIVESDGYNGTTNNPVLTVQGTGGGAVVGHKKKK